MKTNSIFKMCVLLCVMLTATTLIMGGGCGDDKKAAKDDSAADAPASDSLLAFPVASATATIKGRIVLDGSVPKQVKLRMDSDEFCEECHPDGSPVSEKVLINSDNSVPNCFVYVKKGAEKWEFKTPTEEVKLNQIGCLYKPHVFGVMAGQTVSITSNDKTTHNVHFVGKKNRAFNITQKQGSKDLKIFNREEVMAKFKCDIHSWMASYMGVLYHPFFAVTNGNGSFELPKLPAGTYELEVWHEHFGTSSMSVTVADGESKEIEIKLKGE